MADVLIVGGGPAGVQAALYTLRAGIATQIFCEENTALRRAERIENYYGLEGPVEGAELYRRGLAQAQALGARIVREQVVSVEYGTGGYRVVTEKGAYDGRFLLLAVGSARKTIALEGLDRLTGHGVSYCATCDAFFYRGKEAAVLGCGAYALHEAAVLSDVAAKVTLLTNGDPAPETAGTLSVITEPIAALEGAEVLQRVRFQSGAALDVNGFFVALGTAGGSELALKLGVMTKNGRILVNDVMETNVPGVFAAGDCTGGLLQISKAVYDGARAGLEIVRRNRTPR